MRRCLPKARWRTYPATRGPTQQTQPVAPKAPVSHYPRMAFTRRTFIKAGAFGAAALVVAGGYEAWHIRNCSADSGTALSPEGRRLFAAILPAFLDGVVAPAAWTPAMMSASLSAVETTIAALSPAARAELHQLFCLLDRHPIRFALTGIWASWHNVDAATAKRFLERWRYGSNVMFTSAYQALHDISYGSWYADPAHWPDTGYPGPPNILGTAA